MIFDPHRLCAPAAAGIFETTHQLLLFGIDADDRLSLANKASALPGDVAKLPIPLRATVCGDLFAVAAKRNTQLTEQPTHGVGTDVEPPVRQRLRDLTQAPMRARTAPSHRVARQRIGQQGTQLLQEVQSMCPLRHDTGFCF